MPPKPEPKKPPLEVVKAFLEHPDVQAAFPQGAAEALAALKQIK